MFGGLSFFLLMAALGYANNLLYFFVFFLLSVALTAMVITDRNIHRIKISACSIPSCYVGEDAVVQLHLYNTDKRPSFLIEGKIAGEISSVKTIDAGSAATLGLKWKPTKRGWNQAPRVQIQSSYPFGMLNSWKLYHNKEKILVFPARRGFMNIPLNQRASELSGELGLFRDLREYLTSDSSRRIDWRASTKHQKLLTKNFESEGTQAYHFSWLQTQALEDFERRISQLAAWIDLCEKMGYNYSLEIGSFISGVSHGNFHYQKCLQFLAELEPEMLS